jgi:hypothetical protein
MRRSIFIPMMITLCILAACSPASVPVDDKEAEGQPASSATGVVISESSTVDQCVECHTDKSKLIDTAKPEEVVVKESEGTG